MDINKEIRSAIVEALMLDRTLESLADDEDLRLALGIDSVGFLQILVALEDQFGLQLDDGALQKESVNTISKLVHLVENYRAIENEESR